MSSSALLLTVDSFNMEVIDLLEALQVIKYGMNGHYHPHLDYDTKFDVENWGNRIATLLYHVRNIFKIVLKG